MAAIGTTSSERTACMSLVAPFDVERGEVSTARQDDNFRSSKLLTQKNKSPGFPGLCLSGDEDDSATFQEAYEKAAPPTTPSTGLFARYRIWAPHSGPSPDNDTAKRARSTAGTLPYVATRTISSGPSSERAPSNGSAIVFQRGSVSSGGLHPGTGPQDVGRTTSFVFSSLFRRSRAFISLGFPEAPFHPRISHTFRARALRETAHAASSRIGSRIVVSRVWPKIFMPTHYTKTLAVFTPYLWGRSAVKENQIGRKVRRRQQADRREVPRSRQKTKKTCQDG